MHESIFYSGELEFVRILKIQTLICARIITRIYERRIRFLRRKNNNNENDYLIASVLMGFR